MNPSERIGWLLFLQVRHKISRKEKKELSAWRKLSAENESLFQSATDPVTLRRRIGKMPEARQQVLEKLHEQFPDLEDLSQKGERPARIFYITTRKKLLAVAASVVIGGGWFFMLAGYSSIKAGGYHASVISPEGETDNLNSAWSDFKRGFQAGKAGVVIEKENGQYIYVAPNEPKSAKTRFYTLFTKAGGEFILQLADGTTVRVNAATSIRYPANFSQDTIHITVDGEAYFEIPENVKHVYTITAPSRDQAQPPTANRQPSTNSALQISTKAATFNLMSYPEEPSTLFSLIGGTADVRLDSSAGSSPISLVAGQQVSLDSGRLNIMRTGNLDDAIAWKNNRIIFHDAEIRTIMRQVARWYDVTVIYDGNIPDRKFSLDLPSDTDIYVLLRSLETQGLHFQVEKKTVILRF
ncbi:MAG TPA: FecR family protein [Puia sp.]|nr:FecR family protein [Puia sp.]